MDFDQNVQYLSMAFWQIVIVAGPILLVALSVGLFIGLIQAATSINEMTLSFVPKLFIVLLTMSLMATSHRRATHSMPARLSIFHQRE